MENEKDTITLSISKEQEFEFDKLCTVLSLMNIDHHIDYGDPTQSGRQEKLIIEYNQREVYKKLHRGRGRQKKRINRRILSIKEVEEMIKCRGAERTAEELGISRATLFRRLKEARENGYSYLY